MIKSFNNKWLVVLYETGKSPKINPQHKEILRELLFQLDNAICPADMDTPGNDFHPLKRDLKGFHFIPGVKNKRLAGR